MRLLLPAIEGEAVWRRITHAVAQLANKTPPGPVH
jgi:hypothetical protein